jgi:hypothetical protein
MFGGVILFGNHWNEIGDHSRRWARSSTRRQILEVANVLWLCYFDFQSFCASVHFPKTCKGIKFTAARTQITELYFWFVKRRWGRLFALFITVQQWERERDAISSTSGRFVCPSGSAERDAQSSLGLVIFSQSVPPRPPPSVHLMAMNPSESLSHC